MGRYERILISRNLIKGNLYNFASYQNIFDFSLITFYLYEKGYFEGLRLIYI